MWHILVPTSVTKEQLARFIDGNKGKKPIIISLHYKRNMGGVYSGHVYLMLLSDDSALLIVRKSGARRGKSYLAWQGKASDIRGVLLTGNANQHANVALATFLNSGGSNELGNCFDGLVGAFGSLGIENIYEVLKLANVEVKTYFD